MTVSLTAAELEQGFSAMTDLVVTVRAGLKNKAADEQVISDGFQFTEEALPEYAPALMALNFLVDLFIEKNTQGEPGSQTPMTGGPPASRIPPP